MNLNPLLTLDYYKITHSQQYNPNISRIVSYFTPRTTRIDGWNKVVMFGLQGFIKDYLIRSFNDNFFSRPREEVVSEYKRLVDCTLGKDSYDLEKVGALHDLGYLPIKIRALPEGSLVDLHVPMIEITNTHPKFAWLVNTLETALSTTLWHTMVSANVGYEYRKIVNEFYDLTVDDTVPRARALGDFSMRGQESIESAEKSSAAFLLSFLNTATVPAIAYLERNYNCNVEKDQVGFDAISTEHSVMCSNFAIDGDEITLVRRLLTEIYPHHTFSMVSDSYDYWNLVDNILPQLKKEILEHDGTLLIRGDSGDPVEIVTQTVFHLWDLFGGTVNSKGYKVLDPHVKALYGDSITLDRCSRIYAILEESGFACNNVALGVGSFSMQCLEEAETAFYPAQYHPFTRDTFGIAIKATYCEDNDGNCIPIFKNPKTDSGHFKKSQKGCCTVHYDGNHYTYSDGLTYDESYSDKANMLLTVFSDGNMVKEYSLDQIRLNLHNGSF